MRRICHLNMLDMTEIYGRNTMTDGRQNCFMANKFDYFVDSNVILCAARRIHLQEYLSLEEDKPKEKSLEDLKREKDYSQVPIKQVGWLGTGFAPQLISKFSPLLVYLTLLFSFSTLLVYLALLFYEIYSK